METVINLVSDTVTKPTQGMLEAMLEAKVGDDVYKEDPAVNKLEDKVAKLLWKEAALFFPSGTMANQAAIKVHTQPGQQLICDRYAHIFHYEGGGVSFNSGVSCRLVHGERGMMTADQVAQVINPPDFYHSPLTSLVCIENTTNKGGGACWSVEELKRIKQVCAQNALGYHLDGARLWNALAVQGEDPRVFGDLFDSISVCLSKGLGAPVGSVVAGSKDFVQQLIRVRKVFGGGMRQAGYLAAAGIYALDNHRARLVEDLKKAGELANALAGKIWVQSVEPCETNIVIFTLDESLMSSQRFVQEMEHIHLRISQMGEGKWRMVTHLDYTDAMHDRVLTFLDQLSVA
ncbi:MAG: threonine aldolase family protein [Flavobacteriaceae bacterium]